MAMIRIKAVDAQNILDVCNLTTIQDSIGTTREAHFCCNAVSIAETKYNSEMYPNAIYNNTVLIGFLCISVQKIKPIRQPFAAL